MKLELMRTLRTMLISAVLIVAFDGCGGGSHSPLPGPGASPVKAVTGVAAAGAPIFGTVTLKDASSPATELTTSTASDGTYLFDTANLKAPFILRIVSGANTYYSIATEGSGITNINPLTTIVVSVAAGGANLSSFYNAWYSPASAATVLNLSTADASVQTALAPVLNQFGVTGSLLNSTYVADHTGADAMLDVIGISVSTTGSITLTNKATAAVIFTAPASNIATGVVTAANIPAVPVQSLGATLYRANCTKCHGDIMNSSIIGRSSVIKIMGAIASDFGGMSVLGALTPEEIQAISDAIPAQAAPTAPGTLTGSALYTNNCASCHGPLATSTKLGVTIVRLQNAISNNTGNMGRFSTLNSVDMQAIVAALNPVTTTPPATTLDGATIYATNCSGCHGPLATSTKRGLTIARFYAAVTNPATGMGYLSSLSMAEVQALISVLPAPTTAGSTGGQLLYETNCASCHGPFASSTKAGATVARINAGITANPVQMGGFATSLTTTQIADIATALATVVVAQPPAGTPVGQTLYGTYCSGCHGPYATSTKAGPSMSLARIQAGSTANPTTMGASLTAAALTTQNLTDIATQLALLAAPVLDGPGLYAANCAGCHNPLATSTKGGATAAKIQQEITNNRAGVMGAANLVALTPTQIGLIATSLAAITPPACGSCHAVSLASVTGSGHNTHNSKPGAAILTLFKSTNGCGVCHGAGYSTTSNSSLLTHNDGIRTVATNTTGVATATANATLDKPIVWVPPVRSTTGTITTKGTCSPACHNPAGAKRSW